jgi:hypothetical protein
MKKKTLDPREERASLHFFTCDDARFNYTNWFVPMDAMDCEMKSVDYGTINESLVFVAKVEHILKSLFEEVPISDSHEVEFEQRRDRKVRPRPLSNIRDYTGE